MDPMTIAGLVFILVTSFVGTSMGGINFIGILLGDIGSIVLVLGGTMGATMASGTLDDVKSAVKAMIKAFTAKKQDNTDVIVTLVEFAETARRDGLLALEDAAKDLDEAFLQKGMQLAIDGTDPEVVREILETELDALEERHRTANSFFVNAAGFAPAFGVAGTVIGLINMLNNLTDPSALGPAIALAFITTLWGVFLANYIFTPIANKLKRISAAELAYREVVLEGILSIQAGSNPRSVADKLSSRLAPAERNGVEQKKSA